MTKSKCVIKYSVGTKYLKLTLMVDKMTTIRWWVVASFGTHWNSKGRNGGMMSFSKGAVMSLSKKTKTAY